MYKFAIVYRYIVKKILRGLIIVVRPKNLG